MPRLSVAASMLLPALLVGTTGCAIRGSRQPAASEQTVQATRGDLVVSVGGLGKIVEAHGVGQQLAPSASGSSTTSSAGAATTSGAAPTGGGGAAGAVSVPPDAVLPRASGRVAKLLVPPGRQVVAGEALAVLDDGGLAASAVLKARNDLAMARLELRQKQTSDPLKGLPPLPAELTAGRLAVLTARDRLARLLDGARPADVSAARLDVKRAEADLETLEGGTPAARIRAIAVGRLSVRAARDRLDAILAPPSPADVSAAEYDVRKAEADFADLLRADPPPSPEAVVAARKAVDAARLKLAKLLGPPSPADVSAARLELARAQSELETLQAGPSASALAAAEQAVAAARARLAQLLGPPLQSDVTAARLDVRKALADLAVLRARGGPASTFDIGLAELKVEAARAGLAVARFAERQLVVRAPWSGTVTGVLTIRGAPVDVSTPIATVADLGHLAVSVDMSEFDAAQVRIGLPAVVSVDALGGRRFPGTVLFEALTGVDNGGVVTFPVRVALSQVAGVKPGMNASVRIVVGERKNVVQVPLEAVSRDDRGRPAVEVVDASGGKVSRPVKLGLSNNKDVQIVRGLRAGERVVIAGGQGE